MSVVHSPPSDEGLSSESDDVSEESSEEDAQGIVSVGDLFVYSDEEEGDSTLTVKRIVRGDIVYVEEDEETLCLDYVRKKVSLMRGVDNRRSVGYRKSSRARRNVNYEES